MSAVAEARLRALKSSRWCARGLVIGAFALSSVALGQLAADAHIPVYLAWIWPLCVDGAIYQATSAVMALGGRKETEALAARRWFQWVIGGGVLVSVAANVLHAWTLLGNPLTWWQIAAIAIVPPILLAIATHGVTIMAGLDDVTGLDEGQGQPEEQSEAEPEPEAPRVTVERIEPVDVAPKPERDVELVEGWQSTAIDCSSTASPVVVESPRRPVVKRDRSVVLTAQQLAAEEIPLPDIANKLGVSTRTVRRYLSVEVEETTTTPQQRPQLVAVRDAEREIDSVIDAETEAVEGEVVNG